jgi:hypothetical protein
LFGATSAFMAELDRHALHEIGAFPALPASRSAVQFLRPSAIRRRKKASAS